MANMNFPFPIQSELTAISLAYTNRSLIADEVLPRTPVPAREFKWLKMNKDQMFTVPETMVGRKGQPNEVEFGGTEEASFVYDYGLDDVVPQEDLDSAPTGYDPLGIAVSGLTELIALDREKRVADLVFSLNTYPAANRATLSGTDQWSDYTNSDPYSRIMTALDGMLMRPNVAVIGRLAFSKLRVHPKITASLAPSTTGNTLTVNGQGAPATAQAIADLLELDRIIIGEAFINTAKPGQTASLSRCWGKHMAFLHQNPVATIRGNAVTFGFTAEYGNRVAGSMPEPKVGLRGAQRVRTGESVNELIVANDVGYFFQNVVA
ncbi:MAG: phage capsid protein [Burkholderiaceae bacterium]